MANQEIPTQWVINEGTRTYVGFGGFGVLHRANCPAIKRAKPENLTQLGLLTATQVFFGQGGFDRECRKCVPEFTDGAWLAANLTPTQPRRRT